MTFEEYYKDNLPILKRIEDFLNERINNYPVKETADGLQPIIYCQSRIKKPKSMIKKLEKLGLDTDCDTAMREMHDAIGVRIVCSFIDDVYEISNWLEEQSEYEVIQVKDYIAYPKPNGYRSLHLILRFNGEIANGIMAEVQLRTIATDFWAALEHQLKYKRNVEHEKTIRNELKRCADEIASVDMSMQTIRDIIRDDSW